MSEHLSVETHRNRESASLYVYAGPMCAGVDVFRSHPWWLPWVRMRGRELWIGWLWAQCFVGADHG